MVINTMGGICSRSGRSPVDRGIVDNAPVGSFQHANGHSNNGSGVVFQSHALPVKISSHLTPSPVGENMDKQLREPFSFPEPNVVPYGLAPDDLNDGIPRLNRVVSHKSRSTKSKQAVAKVSLTLICSMHVFAIFFCWNQ